MKKSISIIITIFLGSLLVGCSKENQKNSTDYQVMKRAEATELLSVDISLATDTVSHTALYNTYEGLYRLGSSNEVIPAGATKLPQVSEDGRKYTIELNKKSKWSDDKPVTAKDYVFSWQRTIDPQTESQYAQLFSNIKNAKKIMTKELKPTELGIKAIDDYKLEIELESATPYFQNLLAFPNFFPQREDIVKKYGSEYATTSQKAVYNGAFTLTNYDASSGGATKWTYKKNQNYWDRSKVKLDKIENTVVKDAGTAFAMYESGKLDETYLLGEYVNQNKGEKEVITILKPSTYYLQFNMIDKDSFLSNKEVRQAMSSITNRKEIVENVLNNGSREAISFVPKGVYYNPDTGEDFSETYEPKMEYNVKNGVDTWNKVFNNQKMEIKLLIPDDDGIKKVAEYLQESGFTYQWNEILL
ncbi:peptide ABC transporter substrate-binding protein [Enterococcus wangshanyuanii]|uniref:Peptide ABC transporter substrate-binding protein n=1 Tax=Enterococcus wangshanyuanii TaxID=2005703 RepID=A0ABQ1PWV2_9ENTE|nr:peptide ABC transporter substrate-binding protein [Enterococcus wangshanyuanii]GGD05460.1 peptide ABC transporter substrate-binding protein [Enterococcus wangshanyuanii]